MRNKGAASVEGGSLNVNLRSRYSYHPSKPALLSEIVGEYTTKEARNKQAAEIKAAHF